MKIGLVNYSQEAFNFNVNKKVSFTAKKNKSEFGKQPLSENEAKHVENSQGLLPYSLSDVPDNDPIWDFIRRVSEDIMELEDDEADDDDSILL